MKKILLIMLGYLLSSPVLAEPIQLAENLERDASHSRSTGQPMVLFLTADHCPYCETLRQEYFRFSTDDKRFILRELELDQPHTAIDFDGTTTNHRELARRYDLFLTPTVAFVGPDGEKLTDSIIGVLTMDYYHYYFEQALAKSITELNSTRIAQSR